MVIKQVNGAGARIPGAKSSQEARPVSERKLRLAFVVATKDRPQELRRMLASLAGQPCPPDQVVIVDASAEPVQAVAEDLPELRVKYLRHERPSAAAQRNAGIRAVAGDVDLIGFLDDDAVLAPGAIEAMMAFWEEAPADVGGAGFNLMNPTRGGLQGLKRSRLAERLGLYASTPGRVMPSGWQTLMGDVERTVFVEWLPSGASVWRRRVLEDVAFDEFFDGYSYVEDVDFSYRVSRRYRLAVVAAAGFYHYPALGGRRGAYYFGKVEARNRLYFVRKHGLSVSRCCLGIGIRMLMTLGTAVRHADVHGLGRAMGNCVGIVPGLLAQVRDGASGVM